MAGAARRSTRAASSSPTWTTTASPTSCCTAAVAVALWRQVAAADGAAFDFKDVTKASGIADAAGCPDCRTRRSRPRWRCRPGDRRRDTRRRRRGAAGVWRNNGDGTFADITTTRRFRHRRRSSPAPSSPTDVDLRRDIDLVVLGDDGRVRLWRNMRDASFREVAASFGLARSRPPRRIAVGDFTKDGFPDIAVERPRRRAACSPSVSRTTASRRRPLEALPARCAGRTDAPTRTTMACSTSSPSPPMASASRVRPLVARSRTPRGGRG